MAADADSSEDDATGGRPPVVSLLLALLVIVIVAALAMALRSSGSGGARDLEPSIRTKRFQQVILSNERVYFGRLVARDGNWFELQDAFFIREETDKAGKTVQKVVPITRELAEPDGDLLINGADIVTVANLTADSKVTAAIEDVLE